MKRCKVCGEVFAYYVTNAHLETHGLTRAEYKAISGTESTFCINSAPYDRNKDEIEDYVIKAMLKNKKRALK